MKVSVISWIWVTAWKIETSRPTIKPTSISGRPIFSAIRMASCDRE